MSIEAAVTAVIAQATSSARTLAEAQRAQSERIRAIPAQTAQLLALAAKVGARDRLLPAVGVMTAALDEHRRALGDVIAELERLAGAAS